MIVAVLNALFALTVVAASIGLLVQGARWLGLASAPARPFSRGARRLEVLETASLDARRRLLLVRIDDEERALLVGGDRDIELAPLAPRAVAGPADEARPREPDFGGDAFDPDDFDFEDDTVVRFGRRKAA